MKKTIVLSTVLIAVVCFLRCNNPSSTNGSGSPATVFSPVPFPNVSIPGFTFPENADTINTWLTNDDSAEMTLHGWGIWAGLTAASGYTPDSSGNFAYVFETWDSPTDLQDSMSDVKMLGATASGNTRIRQQLQVPRQFEHEANNARIFMQKSHGLSATNKGHETPCDSPQSNVGVYPLLVTVAYDIPAASHIVNNKLFDSSALAKMYNDGKTDIPEFPNTSIAIKPTYEVIPQSAVAGGFFPFRVWSGPNFCDSGYNQPQWPGLVYIDVNNASNGNGSIDMNNSGKNAGNSYNLNSFIYYRLTPQQADDLVKSKADKDAKAGDYVILVGMHVTSKEIKRWTWQTFWWSPNTTTPPMPSSAYIAGKRPSQITGAPAHYAMALAYTFTMPNQPYTGGSKTGVSQIAFNPFLEAGFGSAGTNNAFYSPGIVVNPGGGVTLNKVGCQTNCMSCHAIATFAPNTPVNPNLFLQPGNYIPDTYIDMKTDSNFKNRVKLDFLWSIQASLLSK